MKFQLTIQAANLENERKWARELEMSLQGLLDVQIQRASEPGTSELSQVLFLDESLPQLSRILERLDRKGRAVFLLVGENSPIPEALQNGQVDDVLVHPFRSVEVLSKIKHYQQLLMWDEVRQLNASFSELIGGLREDLNLAERLQKGKFPVRFPEVKGFKIANRYLVGMRSGGDHFDLAESQDGNQLSMILSDSSSYGLSSAVLSVLMRVTMKLSSEESRSCRDTVQRIRDELLLTLNEKDQLSLFYGVVSRKDYLLRFLNLGTSSAYYADAGGKYKILPSQGGLIRRQSSDRSLEEIGPEGNWVLQPGGRFILVSDGFVEAAGGSEKLKAGLDLTRGKEAVDVLNELVFEVKSKFKEADDMPAQDCTATIFDVDARIMRMVT